MANDFYNIGLLVKSLHDLDIYRMPENALIDDKPPPLPTPAAQPTSNQLKTSVASTEGGKTVANRTKSAKQQVTGGGGNNRRLSVVGLLATDNKNNSKKERKNLLGRLSTDLEYLEELQV